jgi:hypothetical protein
MMSLTTEITATEIAARKDAVRFAIANTEIDGGVVLPEARSLLERWVQGEIDDEELIEQAYGVTAQTAKPPEE